jgi:predicted metal-dependent hydrolase
MSDDKLETAINRAAQADALMRNELLTEAFVALDAEYVRAWRVTPARDAIAREKLWQAVNVLGKVRDHLDKIIRDGKLAQAEVNMRQAPHGERI